MLRQLSKEASDCYAHAEDCARRAAEATTDKERDDYRRLERHWLTLALSYEFGERLRDFSKENQRRRAEFYGFDTPVHTHEYRLFVYGNEGHLVGPAKTIPAINDEEAAAKAETIRGHLAAELMDVNGL